MRARVGMLVWMISPGGLRLTKDGRIVVSGSYCDIEYAVRIDGSEPARELVTALREQIWPDPTADELPDSYQASILSRLLASIQTVANGIDPEPGAYNFLGGGMWEFKASALRLTYYDTDGKGASTTVTSDAHSTWDGSTEHEMPFGFGEDGIVRLGHHFPKPPKVRYTPPEDLKESFTVREEDFLNDKR